MHILYNHSNATGTVVMKQYITNLTKLGIFAVLGVQLRRL